MKSGVFNFLSKEERTEFINNKKKDIKKYETLIQNTQELINKVQKESV